MGLSGFGLFVDWAVRTFVAGLGSINTNVLFAVGFTTVAALSYLATRKRL